MSKVFQRLGTKKQTFSYDITIHSIQISLNTPVRINIVWKRRQKRIETRNKAALSPSVGSAEINETLTMINTLYQEKSGKFQRKKAALTVQAIVENKGMKKVGSLSLNISDYHTTPLSNQAFALENCPDRNARIVISVRAQALGDATIADNMSDASGVTGFSMGTEGDYKADLFNDQDLGGFEEEALAPKIIPGSHGKPPIVRGPFMKLPDTGPLNPMKISEAMDNQRLKLEEENSSLKTSEIKASMQLLEKENIQLRSEKDDLKVQLGISLEKSKKERENYFEHMKKLDSEIEAYKKKNEGLTERVTRRDEKIATLKQENESILNDLKTLEKSALENNEGREKAKVETERMKSKIVELEQKVQKLNKHVDGLIEEKNALENNYHQLQVVNNQLKVDIEQLRHDVSDSRENYSSRGENEAFESYKKKTDVLINNYKRDIKALEHEREEALSKQTDMALELQKAKSELGSIDERYRAQVLQLEKKCEDLTEEVEELKQKLDEQMQHKKVLERKSSLEKSDIDSKYSKVLISNQELKAKKESLEQSIAEYERQLKKKQNDIEAEALNSKKLIEKLQVLEKKVNKYKEEHHSKNKEIEELTDLRESLEQENATLREHLKTATTTEFSDPANIILQEQVEGLQHKLKQTEQSFFKEKSSLHEKVKILENQVSILEKKRKDLSENYESQISKLTVDNSILKDQLRDSKAASPAKSQTSNELIAEMQNESNNQTIQLLKMDLNEFKSKLSDLQEEYKGLEKKYVDAKMGWANADLEKENIIQKYRDAQEQLRDYSAQYTVMEVEMYKINERFGQTLNTNNELEMEVNELRAQLQDKGGKKKKFFEKIRG